MKVIFFHRKPRPNVNFSVENLFKNIRHFLPSEVEWEVKELRFFSEGFFKRLYLCLEAAAYQKGISHVTGDINFVAILLRKSKTVLTILDVGFMSHPNKLARRILRLFWIVLPVRRSSIVTTISISVKNELLKYVAVEPGKINVVYVPISSAFIRYDKPFNNTEPVILQIGTKPNKNVHRLVQALRGISCRLEIVGEINETLALELKKAEVKFTTSKNLSNEEILEKYKACDILSFVSTYEGFGMPIVEGNAIGRVVVTSNILSMPEIGGDAAHFVNPFDVESIRAGILKVIEDESYRTRLIANGFINGQRFDAKAIAQQYNSIYKSLEGAK